MTKVDTLLDNAFLAFNKKHFEQAEEMAREVLTLSPTNGDGLYLLGLIATRSNAYEPAEKLLYEAVKLYPNVKSYKTALGFALEKQGRLDEALSFYNEFKEDEQVLSQIGFIYLQKGQNDFAKTAFDEIIKKNNKISTAYIGEALIYRRLKEEDKALDILWKGYKLAPTAELIFQLAVSLHKSQELNEALTKINEALKYEKMAAFWNEKGLIEEELGDCKAAKLSYEEAIEANAYFPDAFANLGNFYLKENNLKDAEYYFKRAIGLDNKFLNAHHNLAVTLHKQNRISEALEHYRSALLVDDKHISSLYNLAIILEETGEYSEAAGLYFNILLLEGKMLDIEFRIADTLTKLASVNSKCKKQAQMLAKGWIKNFPENPIALYTHAALMGEKVEEELAQKYTESLYNSFADTYDAKMEKLQSNTLDSIIKNIENKIYTSVLDLGCGTGTFAKQFKGEYKELTGVDISKNMLSIAKEKDLYTHLAQRDIMRFFEKTTEKYDLIIASDVTGYITNIEKFLNHIEKHLIENGAFIFSIEESEETKESMLAPCGRYVYNPEYIEKVINNNQLTVKMKQKLQMRKEGNGFAQGIIYSITK